MSDASSPASITGQWPSRLEQIKTAALDGATHLAFVVIDALFIVGLAYTVKTMTWLAELGGANLPKQVNALEEYTLWFAVLGVMVDSSIRFALYLWGRVQALRPRMERGSQ